MSLPLQINGKLVTLPATSQIQGVSITSRSIHTIVNIWKEVEVKFDGSHFLQIKVPASYYGKVKKMPSSLGVGGVLWGTEQHPPSHYTKRSLPSSEDC